MAFVDVECRYYIVCEASTSSVGDVILSMARLECVSFCEFFVRLFGGNGLISIVVSSVCVL